MKKRLLFLFLFLMTFTAGLRLSASAADFYPSYTVTTAGGKLNVRQTASLSSEVVATLPNKKIVAVYRKSGDWYKVEYKKGKYGYCHGDYLTPNTKSYRAYVNTESSLLNVRKGRGTDYEIKDKLSDGTIVTVISEGSSFHKIIYNGTKTGYVAKDYLLKAPLTYKKLSLSVPSYKQTDSRWKHLTIGSQGGTMGTIGCTTTALSMTESFHTGSAVTPSVMRSKLSYMPSGSLYWPTDYNTELVSSGDYLRKIYAVLSSGKPVILGAKSTNGKQHWVVVTGHTSNVGTLSKSRFTINDPGSTSRTTLADFLNDYQIVYKIAYHK